VCHRSRVDDVAPPEVRDRARVHPKVVSERLGHATVALTLDTYTNALPDLQETAAGMVAALVFEPALEVG
jgi:integrase